MQQALTQSKIVQETGFMDLS